MIKEHIRAVLFDKDGTVIDFHHSWHPLFMEFLDALSARGQLETEQRRELQTQLGGSGQMFESTSLFATGNFPDIHHCIQSFIADLDFEELGSIFRKVMASHDMGARAIGNADETLESLRASGYHLGIATADYSGNARKTLIKAGLERHFPFVGGSDSVKEGKPAPDLMHLFCSKYGLEPSQVAMVGDTINDMQFGRNSNAGQVIFVQSSFPDSEAEKLADLVLPDINSLTLPG